ncbi:MAG: DUF1501 domain-containing protein [Fuerstiella sp.]|nr:DUF1501 domain-containing protein [Fuerstiella sp.]
MRERKTDRFTRQQTAVGRRQSLTEGLSLAGVALSAMLQRDGFARSAGHPVAAAGTPQFAPSAKRVIWLMMRGGVSHFESFDPKPKLARYAGKTISETPYADQIIHSPFSRNVREQQANNVIKTDQAKIWPMQVGYRKCGRSGAEVSDWWPHVRRYVDDIAIIRSMWTTDNNHGAQMQFLSGRHVLDGCFPTIGSWIRYGLSSLNDNLPQFISIGPTLHRQCFEGLGSAYLGPEHSGVRLKVDSEEPLPYARPELDVTPQEQAIGARLLGRLNRMVHEQQPDDIELSARIKSYELAFRMQKTVPDLMRSGQETQATQKMYGLDRDVTRPFGEQLLATRRLIEQGVRFVQVFHGEGSSGSWDAHHKLVEQHSNTSEQVDQPIAALLQDLKQRGLLSDTVVVWCTEFGRTPGVQGADGRDHHNYGFSVWMAGGGIKSGVIHGATDELGFHAVENRHYVTDIHATIYRLLGLNPRELDVPGRKRLEIDYGHPITDIIA